MYEICAKLAMKTPEQWQVAIINFEQITYVVLVFPLMISNKQKLAGRWCYSAYIFIAIIN